MSWAPLNNHTAPDRYDDRAMVVAPGAVRFNVDVANAAIAYQFGTGIYPGAVAWDEEVFLAPGFRSFDRLADVLRIRAWTPAANLPPGAIQAQVTMSALGSHQVAGAGDA